MAKSYQVLAGAMIALLLALAALALFGKPVLNIKVTEFPITGEANRHYYKATLSDWSLNPVTLEAIKNADDRSGGGTFFPCEISARNQATGEWSTLFRGTLAEEGRSEPEQTLTIIPFEKKYVCDIVLPRDGDGPIDCVRITLHTHWQTRVDQADEVASKTVPVPKANTRRTAPCTN